MLALRRRSKASGLSTVAGLKCIVAIGLAAGRPYCHADLWPGGMLLMDMKKQWTGKSYQCPDFFRQWKTLAIVQIKIHFSKLNAASTYSFLIPHPFETENDLLIICCSLAANQLHDITDVSISIIIYMKGHVIFGFPSLRLPIPPGTASISSLVERQIQSSHVYVQFTKASTKWCHNILYIGSWTTCPPV